MFDFIKNIFAKNKKPVIKNRSSKNGESITRDEANFIAYGVMNNIPACPDCEDGILLRGPQGGCSTNCLCNNCKSEFNITWMTETDIIAERNSPKFGCSEQRQKMIYGISSEKSSP